MGRTAHVNDGLLQWYLEGTILRLKPKDKFRIVREDIEFEFEVAEEGGYVVSVPELPGCLSEGDTFEQAWEMIQDAMEGWLHVASKHGDAIPSKFKRLIARAQLRARWLRGCTAADAVYV